MLEHIISVSSLTIYFLCNKEMLHLRTYARLVINVEDKCVVCNGLSRNYYKRMHEVVQLIQRHTPPTHTCTRIKQVVLKLT